MERQFSERQLIRWAVPGWVTLFLVMLLTFVHAVSAEEFRSSIVTFLNGIDGGTLAAAGAAAIALGFALGIMLFQIYFSMYWCDWKLWKFPFATLVGKRVNYKEVVDSLAPFKSRLEKEFEHWPVEASGGTERQAMEASVVAAYWRGISRNKEEERIVWENRNQYLVAVYHSFGAMLVGAYLTVPLYLFGWATLSRLWLPLIINLVILAAWIGVLLVGRKNTEFSHRSLTKHALHYFYQQDTEESKDK